MSFQQDLGYNLSAYLICELVQAGMKALPLTNKETKCINLTSVSATAQAEREHGPCHLLENYQSSQSRSKVTTGGTRTSNDGIQIDGRIRVKSMLLGICPIT